MGTEQGERDALLASGASLSRADSFTSRPRKVGLIELSDDLSKWYMLGLLWYLTTIQCMLWFTFGTDPDPVKTYYDIKSSVIDLLLNWGPIVFCPIVPAASWLLARPGGIRVCLIASSVMCVATCVIRLVPCWLSEETRKSWHGLAFLHTGQIIAAAVGPLVMAAPSRLSAVWFPPNRRAVATAVAYLGGSLGAAISFLVAPQIINGNPDRVYQYLLFTLALAVVSLVFVLVHCPDRPRDHLYNEEDENGYKPRTLRDNLSLLCRPVVLLAVLIGGAEAGILSAWGGVFSQIAGPPHFSTKFTGVLGFINGIAAITGMFLGGIIADVLFLGRRKIMVMACFAVFVASFAWVTLQFPSPFADHAIAPSTKPSIIAALCIAGFFQGMVEPLFYELSAEASYPLSASFTAGVITFVYNAVTLVAFFACAANQDVATQWMNSITTVSVALCALLMFFIREDPKRLRCQLSSANVPTAIN
eukprot:m.127720 g.127720  ORF g.127720 m.127720 type:complete len:475 (-) comp16714_c0_seq3:157-1581(-)